MNINKLNDLALLCSFVPKLNSVTFKYLLDTLELSHLEKVLFEESKRSKYSLLEIKEEIQNQKISYITIFDKLYPINLRQLSDPPIVLYYKGDISLLNKPKVGLSGSRKPVSLGKRLTRDLIYDLSNYDLVILSGGALGIDCIAINECLERKFKVLIIMPTSLSDITPKAHLKLFKRVEDFGGLIISEVLFNSVFHKGLFLKRNRILAGLSDILVIIQAGIKSGTISSAYYGVDYNKQIYTYIDNIYSESFKGNNFLIKNNLADVLVENSEIIQCLKLMRLLN